MSQPVDKPASGSQNDLGSIMALTSDPSQYPARSPSRAGESAERSTSRAGEHRRERAPSRSTAEYGRVRVESRAGGDYQRPSSRAAESRASSRAAESRASSRAAESRAPSRAAESRAPSRAAESRAPSRAAESRAPSRAGGYDDDDDIGPGPPTATNTARSTSDLFTGVYRNLKKFGQSREELAPRPPQLRLQLSHSQLQSQSPLAGPSRAGSRGGGGDRHWPQSATATTAPYSFPIQAKNSRSLSLQDSLAKPLPDTPPNPSPEALLTPLAERADILTRLVEDDDESEDDSFMDSTNPAAMHGDADGGMGQGGARQQQGDEAGPKGASSQPNAAGLSPRAQQQPQQSGPGGAGGGGGTAATAAPVQGPSPPSASLSGLVCNVHRTTGREPRPLVGASTTIMGDTLYVFGGRVLSRTKAASITSELYELDLIRRHWTKVEMTGDIPPPRYFHSMCPLGDTKMVCYGGMSPAFGQLPPYQPDQQQQQQPEVSVMTDIHIYDIPTKRWVLVPAQDPPEGRYAHCACVLPSSAVFTSHRAPLSALQHNPSSSANPNEGRIGISIDGAGGAEMIVVGGQDAANHYIEQISVFNLRSLRWTSTQPLGKSCGAYRSVVAPLPPAVSARIGRGHPSGPYRAEGISAEAREPGSSLLIYSNYNFLDVKLELQIRSPDGILSEKLMSGDQSPPGLRFPNGGVIDTHFVVSGTYLTSSKQEYALWALDLRNLTWSRIDAGGNVFSQGSWNRGVLWSRRNGFVILGSRRRSLVDDYNHRRINFTNICLVELEAFGFYDNPRRTSAMSGYVSASSPYHGGPGLSVARKAGSTAGGRFHSRASEELGEKILAMRELADMDILCIGGERIPVSSRIVARRWGPYFVQLLREGTATQDGSDSVTLRSGMSPGMRTTIVPSSRQADAIASSAAAGGGAGPGAGPATSAGSGPLDPTAINSAPTPKSLPPGSRPRILYLPHTYLTIQTLLHYLYCSALPAPSSPLCTPQILCSLLQIARPYRIDGLLEAVIERLHALLDSRNAAAVFNATAMAAGGGRGIDGSLNPNFFVPASDHVGAESFLSEDGNGTRAGSKHHDRYGSAGDAIEPAVKTAADGGIVGLANRATGLTINTTVPGYAGGRPPSDELSASGASVSGSEWSASEMSESDHGRTGGAGLAQREIWNGELSSVVGLQKRGLRGLMEGRRLRERTGTNTGLAGYPGAASTTTKVGLGIAGT